MAGQQVACPLCYGAIILPPAEVLLQFVAPQYPAPVPYEAPQMLAPEAALQAPQPDMVFSITCPGCTNPFQVTAAMSGQQVGCPFCTMPILVPLLQSAYAQQQPAVEQAYYPVEQHAFGPQSTDEHGGVHSTTAPEHHDYEVNSILPPGVEPVTPTPAGAMLPRKSPPKKSEPSEADLMPPSRTKAAPNSKAPAAPTGPPAVDRFPPGFGGGKPRDEVREEKAREEKDREERYRQERLPPRKDQTQPRAEKPASTKIDERLPPPRRPSTPPDEAKADAPAPTPAAPQEIPPPAVDDLLPPGALPPSALPPTVAVIAPAPPEAGLPPPTTLTAQPAASVETLLPPGTLPPSVEIRTALSPTAAATIQPIAPAKSKIDHLLPPGAADVTAAAVEQTTPQQKTSVADAMLPPGAAGPTPNAMPGVQVPLPVSQPGPLRPVLAPGQKKTAPGLDSLQVEGREKEDESLADVKKLSAEEKGKRRFRRNLIMWTVCVLILFAVFYFMAK